MEGSTSVLEVISAVWIVGIYVGNLRKEPLPTATIASTVLGTSSPTVATALRTVSRLRPSHNWEEDLS